MERKVFVYGTLKRGYNNNYLLAQSNYVGEAFTIAKYRLLDAGFPVMMRNGDAPVVGEVFTAPAATIARLDRLEGEGNMYHRTLIKVRLVGKAPAFYAEAYIGDTGYWARRLRRLPMANGYYCWPADRRAVVAIGGPRA